MRKVFSLIFIAVFFLTLTADNSEKLEKSYKKARMMIHKDDFVRVYKKLSGKYPESYYGQLSFLELGKINLLERRYEEAIENLKKIFHPEIKDKEYWLAKAYLSAGQIEKAIVSAQNFIFDNDDMEMIEDAYFIIAEAYLNKKIYKRALNTLEYIRTSKYIKDQIPLLLYKIANCHEYMENYSEALKYYKQLNIEFPYDQYAYLAEDKIYQLQKNKRVKSSDTITGKMLVNENEIKNLSSKNTGKGKKYLQVGAFKQQKSAENQKIKIKMLGLDCITFYKLKNNQKLYIAAAGPFENDNKLKEAKHILQNNNIPNFPIKR